MGTRAEAYSLSILHAKHESLSNKRNVDIVVTLTGGARYSATLFTLKSIEDLLKSYRLTGECGGGEYFYCTDMIIVESLTERTIRAAIDDIIESGALNTALSRLDPSKD